MPTATAATPSPSQTVTRAMLLQGAWFAIEQCGRLLKEAGTLYSVGSHPTSVALAMLAREELGRHYILLDMWKDAATGPLPTVEDVRDACEDHQRKQKHGQRSVQYVGKMDSQLGRASQAQRQHPPGSPEFKQAQRIWDAFKDRLVKNTPAERHRARMAAVYVDVNEDGQAWSRPCSISRETAYQAVNHAMNDYSGRMGDLNQPAILQIKDPELEAALQAWPDRPALIGLPHFFMDGDDVYR